MRTRRVVPVFAMCLVVSGLWAQTPAEAPKDTGSAAADQGARAAPADENDFFGSAPVEAPQGTAEQKGVADVVEKQHVGLSGQLQAMSTYTAARSFVQGSGDLGDNAFSSLVGGDFLVDMRLEKGFKAFLDLNLGFVPGGTPTMHDATQLLPTYPFSQPLVFTENQTTALLIKEVFIDFNLDNTVYFRAGKQVLKWGTGYFWNPTDLINIEHRSFTNTGALLEGVFGLRSDVVFSPAWHLYTFLNLNDLSNNVWDAAFAARSEFLVGSTEFAVSSWLKSGKIPVFGADLTMPIVWKMNLTSEASFSWGDNQDKLDPVTGPYSVRDQLVAKVDVGVGRSFDLFDVQDRVAVNLELFYNSDGYDQNMLAVPGFLGTPSTPGYFVSNYYGQYYAATFVTISDFGTTNTTLTLSALANLSDLSGTALAGLSWSPVNNFNLSFQLGSYLGPVGREYTYSGSALFGILTATVNF